MRQYALAAVLLVAFCSPGFPGAMAAMPMTRSSIGSIT